MATYDIYRLNVDYTLADQVQSATGRVAFVPSFKITNASGTALGTVSNPLVTTSGGSGTGVTVADYSITNMTGASQSVVAAGNGDGLVFLQAPSGNAGTIWINLAGGTAVVGSGVPILPGGYVTIQPGIANAITGIAATINDDLTVYAG